MKSEVKPEGGSPGAGFVDLHAHVLPGVDDGPQSWDSAVDMLRTAAAAGTIHIVATPHGDRRAAWDSVDSLRDLCGRLAEQLESEGVPITLSLGMEVPLELDTADKVDEGRALTLDGSSYILVELPFSQLPLYWEEALFRLQLGGLHPVIAHPERQAQLQENHDLLAGPVSRGILTQLTAGSLIGGFGPKVKRAAEALCKKGLASFLASDCHSHDGSRGPDMQAGFRAAAKLVGQEAAARMAWEIPGTLVGHNVDKERR